MTPETVARDQVDAYNGHDVGDFRRTTLVIQWLRGCAPDGRVLDVYPGVTANSRNSGSIARSALGTY